MKVSCILFRLIRILALAGACVLLPTAALAQTEPEPLQPRLQIDGNGVDLVTGALQIPGPSISIGQPGAGGLSYSRFYAGTDWRPSSVGTISYSGSTYYVSFGSSSDVFTKSGSVFTSAEGSGATLSHSGAIYTYTTAQGVVVLFANTYVGLTWPSSANGAFIIQETYPSGEVVSYHYNTVTACLGHGTCVDHTATRLQGVTNNFGYQLHFDYVRDAAPTTFGQFASWQVLASATAFNRAVDYCDPYAATCSYSVTWPSLTFSGTSVTDQSGRTTSFTYTSGKLTGIQSPSGSSISIGYDGSGRVSSINRGFGTWTYGYSDASGNRTTTVTNPASQTRTVVSSLSTGLISSDTNEAGKTTTFLYDGSGRNTRVTAPEGNYVQTAYDSRGNVTSQTMVAKSGSGLSNIVTSASYPGSCSNQKTCNKPTSTTDARGYTTNYTYNSTHGGVLTVTAPDPDGGGALARPQTRFTYAQKQARYKSGPSTYTNGATIYMPTETSGCATGSSCAGTADETRTTVNYPTTSTPNNLQPTSVVTAAGNGAVSSTTAFTYTVQGDVDTADGPLAGSADTTKFYYDDARQPIGVIGPDPDGGGSLLYRAARTTYNSDGLPTLSERGSAAGQGSGNLASMNVLQKVQTVYDGYQRPVQSKIFDGGSSTVLALTQTSYDSVSRVECVVRRMKPSGFGSPPGACSTGTAGAYGSDRIAKMTYDSAGRLLKTTNAFGTGLAQDTAETTAYTNNGLPANIQDADNNTTSYTYDGFDRLKRVTYPDSSYEEYTYDAGSNVTSFRLRDGASFSMTYDGLSRMTFRNAPGSQPDVTIAYDNFGRTTSVSQSGHSLSYTYDQLSRLTSAGQPLGTVSYQYDSAGRRTRTTWPGSYYVDYVYDVSGAVTELRENGSGSGAGLLAKYTYDNLGRRTAVARAGSSGVSTSYTYDGMSRLASFTHNASGTAQDLTVSFGYNPASQIVSRTVSNTAYKWAVAADLTTNYTSNGLNQIATLAGSSFGHDARGNTEDDTVETYDFDADNRLIEAGTVTQGYDPLGRLYNVAASSTVKFLYDGAAVIGEYDGSNNLLRRYVHGPGIDEPVVWLEGTGTSNRTWLMADERGSVIAHGNASAVVATINTYDPYGLPGSGNVGRFQYTGQMFMAETGLYHYKARAYSAAVGRFLQPDPLRYGDGMNMYAYAGNDPVNLTDPSGGFAFAIAAMGPVVATTEAFTNAVSYSSFVHAGTPIQFTPRNNPKGQDKTSTVCVTPTGSHIRSCVSVAGDLTRQQKNAVEGAFRGFITQNNGADVSDSGKPVIGNASQEQINLVSVVSQFVGYSYSEQGGALASAWAQVDHIRASTTFLSLFAGEAANISRLPSGQIEIHITGRTFGNLFGNPYSNPSALARALLHEPLHLTNRFRNPITVGEHHRLDLVARTALHRYGLGGGGCPAGYGFPAC